MRNFILYIFLFTAVFTYSEEAVFLDVPYFGQGVEWPWGDEPYGYQSPDWVKISLNGCGLASAAMVTAYYGSELDPLQMNQWLGDNDGYGPGYWRGMSIGNTNMFFSALRFLPEIDSVEYYNYASKPADIELIKQSIREGHPVVVTVIYEEVYGHFVVVYGFEGDVLHILDPIDKKAQTINYHYTALDDERGSGPAKNITGALILKGNPPG